MKQSTAKATGKKVAAKKKKPVGLTKSAGWEMGIRKTFPISISQAWDLITSPKGISAWLGKTSGLRIEKGTAYQTKEGISGEFRVVTPNSHIRLSWQPATWKQHSTLQVRVLPAGAKTTISFHHEKLPGSKERKAMLERWNNALHELENLV